MLRERKRAEKLTEMLHLGTFEIEKRISDARLTYSRPTPLAETAVKDEEADSSAVANRDEVA